MNLRVFLVVLFTIILTVFFIYNDQIIEINLVVSTFRVSKALLLPALTLLGLIMGYFIGHFSPANRRRKKELKMAHKQIEAHKNSQSHQPVSKLSEEDQKYLN